jgi:hypothetical protein
MGVYFERERKIPVFAEVDVLVLGAGPAGFSAAVCAAREGVSVMLIEQSGNAGGVATNGLMSAWGGDTKGGFYEEIIRRTSDTTENPVMIDHELLKTVMLEMLEESKVRLLLYTFACDVIKEKNMVKGVIIENKSGRQAVFAKVIIDATGDGDIAFQAGAPCFKGRESDGKMQPMSIMFNVGGVDIERGVFPDGFEDTYSLPKGDLQSLAKEHLPFPAGHVCMYINPLPGVVSCNMTNCINVDGTNAEDLTRATIVCRSQLNKIVQFLREFVPGFEKCYLIVSSAVIGVRETRHFKGEQTITEKDILEAKTFDDWAAAKLWFNFDVHNLDGNGLDETAIQKKFPQKKAYTIPYGCLVPLEVDGLLLAGRNISGTHLAHSNYRIMPVCANVGQSAGVAASLCIKNNLQPRKLPINLLQSRLIELGVSP